MLEVVFVCLGDLCCDSGLGVSILFTHLLPGVLPFYSKPVFNIRADWRISWPFPRPGSGRATTRGLPPHTEEGREDGKKKKWGEERRGEYEAGSERDGTNQKQMLVHVWFSISKNEAETKLSACGAERLLPFISSFTLLICIWTYCHFIFPGWRQTAAAPINNFITFPDPCWHTWKLPSCCPEAPLFETSDFPSSPGHQGETLQRHSVMLNSEIC